MRAVSAEGALSSRLDVVEGDSSVVGSIAKAQSDAQAFATNAIAFQANIRVAAEAVLNLKMDNLAEGDITFVGQIESDGLVSIRQARIDAGDTRNGQNVAAISISAGETFIIKSSMTLSYTDGTTADYEAGDKLMAVSGYLNRYSC